ncbi:MAG: hypothetical protein COS49_01920, partial [Candidatus Portnoybacteria bacterium CG03_land_8_20_14_0_80_41_10]
GFAKSFSPENSLAKPSPHLNSVSFSLRRNPTSPATTIQNRKRENPRQTKKNAWWRGEGGTEQW